MSAKVYTLSEREALATSSAIQHDFSHQPLLNSVLALTCSKYGKTKWILCCLILSTFFIAQLVVSSVLLLNSKFREQDKNEANGKDSTDQQLTATGFIGLSLASLIAVIVPWYCWRYTRDKNSVSGDQSHRSSCSSIFLHATLFPCLFLSVGLSILAGASLWSIEKSHGKTAGNASLDLMPVIIACYGLLLSGLCSTGMSVFTIAVKWTKQTAIHNSVNDHGAQLQPPPYDQCSDGLLTPCADGMPADDPPPSYPGF